MGSWAVIGEYVRKHLWLAALALLTALAYFIGDVVIQVTAQLHPSVRTIVIEKRIEQKDVHIHRNTTYYPDGRTQTTETITDKTRTASDRSSDTDQKPMLAGNAPNVWTAYAGLGRDLGTTYYVGAVNYKVGRLNFQAQVDNPAIHKPVTGESAVVNPRVTGLVGLSF